MFIKIKSDEIKELAKILANNFINVKDKKNLERVLHRYIANYYILSIQKNFVCKIDYNNDNSFNFLNMFKDFYNCFYIDENIKVKDENIEVIIERGGDNEK